MRTSLLTVALASLSLSVAGCGSGSKSTASSGGSGTSPTTPSSSTTVPGAAPTGVAAIVGKTPITVAQFDHWLQVVVASHTTKSGTPVIVPDPPNFTNCIAQAKASGKVPGATTQRLKADCEQLYRVDTDQVMDYLIKSDWLIAAGTQAHVLPSQAEVLANFNAQKSREFKSPSAFAAFLAASKQTEADIMLRIKTGRIESLLSKRAGGAKQLLDQLSKQYVPETHCSAAYVNPDCAEYRPSSG
jgi:hypothetical protein